MLMGLFHPFDDIVRAVRHVADEAEVAGTAAVLPPVLRHLDVEGGGDFALVEEGARPVPPEVGARRGRTRGLRGIPRALGGPSGRLVETCPGTGADGREPESYSEACVSTTPTEA